MADKMDFVRNWVEEVRDLASNWNYEGQSKLAGDELEFQAEYLGSLLCLIWEEVHGVDKASSREIFLYMSEMKKWISKVHVQRHSAKKDVLVPLKSSTVVCNGAPASPASPAYQVFDEMLEPINGSEMSLNSPELLPEVVHDQPEVQTEGYGASIFSSKISISAPPYPSSSLSSTTNVLCEDLIDLESIIPDSLSIDEAHSAISTDNKGLLCAGEAFTVVSPLDGVSPFLKVIPCFLIASEDTSQYCVNLVAFATEEMESFNELVESVTSSSDFVMFCSAYHMFDEMPSREYQLFPCTLMDDLRGSLGHYDLLFDSLSLVFDPGKPMTDRLFDPKSAVVLVLDAWLRTFGVSIWSFDHNCFRFFIFDPGIAYTLLLRVLRTRRRLLCCTILSCFTDHWVGTCVHVTSYVCRLADFCFF